MSDKKLRSLGISETEWTTMIAAIESQKRSVDKISHDRRDGAAHRFPLEAFGGLKLVLPDYRTTSHKIRMRNISQSGVGFFHNAFVHRGTRCYVALRTVNGAGAAVGGTVTWCRFLSGTTHEVGIQCDELVDLTQFLTEEVLASAPDESKAA
ncbi:MAG: PilZ domain-containing protein [Algisphaera sp.]